MTEPMYDGRVILKVDTDIRGTWALPGWEKVSVGRIANEGLHIPHSWVPSRLCRFIPYEMGWLVQAGRARLRVQNKHLGDHVFEARTIVALQPGRSTVTFPELDYLCQLGVVIGAGEAEGLPNVQDGPDLSVGSETRTIFAADRVTMTATQREVMAVVFQHLFTDRERPVNLAHNAAQRLGKSEQSVKNSITAVIKKVNSERWLNLSTTDQLGHYLVRLSRNVGWGDLPPQFQG